jgi:hypothetical protein
MIKKCAIVFICSARYYCPILMTLEFSRQIFETYFIITPHENPPNES